MNYREVFFTAVMVSGLAVLLFGSAPRMQASLDHNSSAPVVRAVL